MNQLEDRILYALHISENFEDLALFDQVRIITSLYIIWFIYYESGQGPYTFRYLHHMTHWWWVYSKTVYFPSRTVYFPRRPYTFETGRIFFGKDRKVFAKDRIVYAGTVYFQAKIVNFQWGPYFLQDRILSNIVFFFRTVYFKT